jgi:hypothetical protein
VRSARRRVILGAEAPRLSRFLANFLSWGSQRSPLCRSKCVASSPSWPPEGGSLSARGCQASRAGRPRRFSRPRRFAPRHTLQVCCALLPAVGFATFRGLVADSARCKHRFSPSTPPFPSGASPFEVFPSTTAPVTSPRPMPSRCSSSLWSPSPDASAVLRFPPRASQPQGFAPLPSPLQLADVAACGLPDTPMGFVPSRQCTSGCHPRSGPFRLTLRAPGGALGEGRNRQFPPPSPTRPRACRFEVPSLVVTLT